jgi:predicted small lipoprotein YifL
MQSFKTTLLILISAAMLSACGLRGPLYLPDEDPAGQPAVEESEDAGENDAKDEEKDKESVAG